MAVVMAVCVAMMARMMRPGDTGPVGPADNRDEDAPEHVLAGRLASGEIDAAGFERLRDAPGPPATHQRTWQTPAAPGGARHLPDLPL